MATAAPIHANFSENDISNDQCWLEFVEAWLKLHNLPPANNAAETAEWHGFTSLGFSQEDRIAARVKLLEHINSCQESKIRTSRLTTSEIVNVVREAVEECKRMAEFMNEGSNVVTSLKPSSKPCLKAPHQNSSMKTSTSIKLSNSSAKAKETFGPRSPTPSSPFPNCNPKEGSGFSRQKVPRRLNLSSLKNLSDIARQRSFKALHTPLTSVPRRSNIIQDHRAVGPQTSKPRLTAQPRPRSAEKFQEDMVKQKNRLVVVTPPVDISLPSSGLYSALSSCFLTPGKEALRGEFRYAHTLDGC
jgi:hypothetical protein